MSVEAKMAVNTRKKGEAIGIEVDDALKITSVATGSLADGNLEVGDLIVSVNECQVHSKTAFENMLQFAFPRLRLSVKRTPKIPDNLEKLLNRRDGFVYLAPFIDWPANKDRQMGIFLGCNKGLVLVSSLKPGSLGEEKFKVGDRVVAINNSVVDDKDVAKLLIKKSSGRFTALVERPTSPAAKALLEAGKSADDKSTNVSAKSDSNKST